MKTPNTHTYRRAVCGGCRTFWPLDHNQPVSHRVTDPACEPLDGDWYTELVPDRVVPVGRCGKCGSFVYLVPSQWRAR